MNIKSFLVAFLFFVSLANCANFSFSNSQKALTTVVTTVGLVLIVDNFTSTLPKFFKEDKYKKLDRESGWMFAKGIGAACYLIWWASFLKKAFDEKYVIGSLKDEIFKTKVSDLLGDIKK